MYYLYGFCGLGFQTRHSRENLFFAPWHLLGAGIIWWLFCSHVWQLMLVSAGGQAGSVCQNTNMWPLHVAFLTTWQLSSKDNHPNREKEDPSRWKPLSFMTLSFISPSVASTAWHWPVHSQTPVPRFNSRKHRPPLTVGRILATL